MPSSPSPGGRPSCSQLWEPSCGLCVPYAPSLSARMSESCVRRVGERRSYTGYNLMLTTTRRRHMPRWSLTAHADYDATTPHATLVLNGSGGTAPKKKKNL